MCQRYIYWLSLTRPQLWTWPTTQACVLPGNRMGYFSVCRLALNPRSHTSQGGTSVQCPSSIPFPRYSEFYMHHPLPAIFSVKIMTETLTWTEIRGLAEEISSGPAGQRVVLTQQVCFSGMCLHILDQNLFFPLGEKKKKTFGDRILS